LTKQAELKTAAAFLQLNHFSVRQRSDLAVTHFLQQTFPFRLPSPRLGSWPALCVADHKASASPLPASRSWPGRNLCVAQILPADRLENFGFRTFPQGFLNHLETPAPYPDSTGLSGFGQLRKSVYEQHLS
jgi:hypothetical protein